MVLVALARDFHMTVVAEGVETEEQEAHALISCGVEESQGYLVAAAALCQVQRADGLAIRRVRPQSPVDDAAVVA